MKIFSISEILTGEEENGLGGRVKDNQSGASDLTISPSYGQAGERALIRENIFYSNWYLSNNYKPLIINRGPDSKLTCNVPGLGSKL